MDPARPLEPLRRPTIAQLKARCWKAVDAADSLAVFRPISIRLTWLLVRTPITPNAVTTVGLLAGLAGCGLMVWAEGAWPVLGVLLMEVAILMDHVDGEVARAKARMSPGGHFYDSAVLEITLNVALMAALGWMVWRQTGDPAWAAIASLLLFAKAVNVGLTQYRGVLTERDLRRHAPAAASAGKDASSPPSLAGRVAGLVWGVKNATHVTLVVVVADWALGLGGLVPMETGLLVLNVAGLWALAATAILLASSLRDYWAGSQGGYRIDFPRFR